MPGVLVDKPYEPVLPYKGRLWPRALWLLMNRKLRKNYGVTKVEYRHLDRLKSSLAAGHGIIISPNHSRDEDPLIIGTLARAVGHPFYAVASWHLFAYSKIDRFILRRAGAFSIYREGMDKSALTTSVDILAEADRPLVIFPEGHISRTNDRLAPLMDGVSLIARMAAKKRAKDNKKVVVHPIALRYTFQGDVAKAAEKVLEEIEQRLTWRPLKGTPLVERIRKVGAGLIALKELEYLGQTQPGTLHERLARLADALLGPAEKEYCDGRCDGSIVARVKRIRSAVLPTLINSDFPEAERKRRWQQLEDATIAQQLYHYPSDYISETCPPHRLFETVERFEEDLTGKIRVHGQLHCAVTVGEAIEVSAGRDKESKGAPDPLMAGIETSLRNMLGLAPKTQAEVDDDAAGNAPARQPAAAGV
jgi:1-acyl-sn-glycerol-3-phosphate acyltransferase